MKFIDFPKINFPIQGIEEVKIPNMIRIRQNFDKDEILNPFEYLRYELKTQDYSKQVRGKRIAITVGSRGIPHNMEIVNSMNKRVIELKNGEVASDWINGADDENTDFDIQF